MKKIVLILFSLVCIVAYPQKRNEYGQKMVKNIRLYGKDYIENRGFSYQFTYDDNNHTTSVKTFDVNEKGENVSSCSECYIIENGKLVHYIKDNGKLVETLDKQVINKYILNDKGHLIQRIQLFPAEREVWNYYYDKDASIYDENLVKVEYIETDRNGNYFIGPMGNVVKPLIVKESDYVNPPKIVNVEFKDFNDTNIPLNDIIIYGKDDLLELTTWVPCYNPWFPIKLGKNKIYEKYEYYNDESDNLSKIIVYELYGDVYKVKRKVEIEYLY